VDGLDLLAAFIEQFSEKNEDRELSRILRKLAKINRAYEKGGRDRAAYISSCEDAQEYLATLRNMTSRVISLAESTTIDVPEKAAARLVVAAPARAQTMTLPQSKSEDVTAGAT
jgi:hypothetical protein